MCLDECSALVKVPQVLFFLHTFRPGGGVERTGDVFALVDLDLTLTQHARALEGCDRGCVSAGRLGLGGLHAGRAGPTLHHPAIFHNLARALAEVFEGRDRCLVVLDELLDALVSDKSACRTYLFVETVVVFVVQVQLVQGDP